MLARAGAGDPEGSGLLGIGPGQALLLLGPLHPGSEQPLLVVVAAVGRAHLGAHAGRGRAIEEGHEVVEDAPVDGEPVGVGDVAALGRLEALGQGVRAVDEAQVPGQFLQGKAAVGGSAAGRRADDLGAVGEQAGGGVRLRRGMAAVGEASADYEHGSGATGQDGELAAAQSIGQHSRGLLSLSDVPMMAMGPS